MRLTSTKGAVAVATAALTISTMWSGSASAVQTGAAATAWIGSDQLPALQARVNEDGNTLAGTDIDASSGTVHVYAVGSAGTAVAIEAVRSLNQRVTASAGTGHLIVQVVSVARSSNQLKAQMARVVTAQPWAGGAQGLLSQWYVSPRDNALVIGLTDPTPALRLLARRTFGPSVIVVQRDRSQAMVKRSIATGARTQQYRGPLVSATTTAPNRLNDSAPFYGGDRIIYTSALPNGYTNIEQCTASFVFNQPGFGRVMSTAGHCGPNGRAWQQGWFDKPNSRIYENGLMGTDYNTQFGNNRPDGELLKGGSYAPRVYTSSSGNSPQSSTPRLPSVGEGLCTDGSFTGQNCYAKVHATNACLNLADNGTVYYVCNQLLLQSTNGSVIVQPGDSGGPVYTHNGTQPQLVAEGIISGGTSSGQYANATQVTSFDATFGVSPVAG